MDNGMNLTNIALYMLKTVLVRFADGTEKRGTFLNYAPAEGTIQLDGDSYALDRITDIEYLAAVDSFHAKQGCGEIGNIRFFTEDLHPDFDRSDLMYGEFVCTVACHLYIRDMEICAGDIRLAEKRHALNIACAAEKSLLYRFCDGSAAIGKAFGEKDEYRLGTANGAVLPLNLRRVADITKTPEMNDYIYLTMAEDNRECAGLVSAVNGTMVILIDPEGKPEFIDLTRVASIRYRGVVVQPKGAPGQPDPPAVIAVGAARGKQNCLVKLPANFNFEMTSHLREGDEVTFAIGMNDSALIAKKVELLQAVFLDVETAPEEEKEYYGLILTVNFGEENGAGYVGSRFVSKACGKPVPGNARFTRDQLNFTLEFNKVFVVKYTASEAEPGRLRTIRKLTLHRVLDSTKYGIIEVTEDGTVNAVPLFKAGISYFENRDVDVLCTNGKVYSGTLSSHGDKEISVGKGAGETVSTTVVPFEDIADIRIVGAVSQYFPNGTGYVDNFFFFHINEMENGVDAQFIRRGTRVSFSLRNSRKGNNVDCGCIRILSERRIDVYVVGYQNGSYTVIDPDKYGKGIHFTENAYEVPYAMYNQFRDLGNEDCFATMTLQRRNGVEECVGIRTHSGNPKLRYGIVTALDREKNTVTIVSPEDYRRENRSATYPVSQQGEIGQIMSPEKKDYPVLYQLQLQDGVKTAVITWVERKEISDKCYFGYLEQYSEEKEFGWIVPDEYVGSAWQRDKRVRGWLAAFAEAPKPGAFRNPKKMPRVCYTLETNREFNANNSLPPAKKIWLLNQKEAPQKKIPAEPVPVSAPVSAPAPVPAVPVEVVLEREYPCDAGDDRVWQFGFVTVFIPAFSQMHIFPDYRNKKMFAPGTEPEVDSGMQAEIPMDRASVDYGPFEKINTSKCVYLVKYAADTSADGYCVVFLKEYRKAAIKSLKIASGILRAENAPVEAKPVEKPAAPAAAAQSPKKQGYTVGETIAVRMPDQEYMLGTFASAEGGTITFADGRSVTAEEASLVRFGVLSAVDETLTVGTMNGITDFALEKMEQKCFNIVKTAKKKMLLCYTCKDGVIETVDRITPELRMKLPVAWQGGTVTDFIGTAEERYVQVSDGIRCYLTVESDGYFQSYIKANDAVGTQVFVKSVRCPMEQDGKTALGDFAYDIRCMREKVLVRHDAGQYLISRNGVRPEPVLCDGECLLPFVNMEAEVTFRVSEEGDSLQACGAVPAATVSAEPEAAEPALPEVPARVKDFAQGETILIRAADQFLLGNFAAMDGNRITFADGRSVTVDEASVVRFGVLTAVDDAMNVGILNGNVSFLFANMDPKTFNIVKNAKRKLLLCYTCKDGIIDHIERITPELRTKMPVKWQNGRVNDYTASADERCILINDAVRCYLSVETDGSIHSLIKEGAIIDTAVFVKTVNCPVEQAGQTVLGCFAYDIHCEQEKSLIRYDAVTDRFLAARNAARAEPVEGNHSFLTSLVDTQADVLYRVSEDGNTLIAYIDSDDGADDWTDEVVEEEDIAASKALFRASLVQYLTRKIDLRTMNIPRKITLGENGWPTEDAQTAELAAFYLNRRFFEIDEAMAAITLLGRLPEDAREGILADNRAKSMEVLLQRSLRRQLNIIARNVNCVWGEYSYYQNTILSDTHILEGQRKGLYQYFLQDFYSRIEAMDILRRFRSKERRNPKVDLQALFRRELIEDTASQLVAHLIALDEASVQYLISTLNVLDGNEALVGKIFEWGKRIDATQEFDSVAVLIDYLRSMYRSDKLRLLRELQGACQKPNVVKSAEGILQIIKGRFVKMITADDAQRFSALQEICALVIENRHAGFSRYRAALLEGWARLQDLIRDAHLHPTQETTEMLVNTGVLANIREEIRVTLNELLSRREYMPDIRCESNGSEIVEGQKNLMLLVSNGDLGHTNRQSAYNVKLLLEVLSGLSADSVPNEIVLPEKELPAGRPDLILDNIPISLDSLDGNSFSIAVSAGYEMVSGFDGKEIRVPCVVDCGIMEFQIQNEETSVKDKNAPNFYLHPSEGNPLKETDQADCNMFFGRQREKAEIWDAIVDENLHLREGRAVMLYGQKKTGKTSLVNQILGRMTSTPEVNDQAIIIRIRDVLEVNGGVTGLEYFSLNFYRNILTAFKLELIKHHKDVRKMLRENGLEIPNLSDVTIAASMFQEFFMEFGALDEGRHRVVLVMDEFTRLCTTLLDYPEYQQIPNFIKLFSGMGFVQIIIGHPNMMKALSMLGIINHTAEFSKRIELTGLQREDAVALIREPMIRSFGYDVYDSPLGQRAIDMLLDLSGCHPSVLMKLCNEMFLQFVETDYPKIIHSDVSRMLSSYLDTLDPATTFDILVLEDGDAASFFDTLPAYRYLKYVALESLGYNNQDCDMDIICPELTVEQNRDIRDTLLMRKVLAAGNGRIRIITKLFLEYVRFKYKNQ